MVTLGPLEARTCRSGLSTERNPRGWAPTTVNDTNQEPTSSLSAIARSLGRNPEYLRTCFTLAVGEYMHPYLVGLRVDHACRLLVGTDLHIKQVSHASGFLEPARLTRACRKPVGVSPRDYRRNISAPGSDAATLG